MPLAVYAIGIHKIALLAEYIEAHRGRLERRRREEGAHVDAEGQSDRIHALQPEEEIPL